jgi:hypothetical protein
MDLGPWRPGATDNSERPEVEEKGRKDIFLNFSLLKSEEINKITNVVRNGKPKIHAFIMVPNKF